MLLIFKSMISVENKIPLAVQRAVGFELTASNLDSLGEDWADAAELYRGFSQQIKEQSLSMGISEQLWDNAWLALLDERKESASSWLQLDFFPSVSSNDNSTTGGTSDTGYQIIDTEIPSTTFVNPASDNSASSKLIELEDLVESENEAEVVEDDPLQQDLIQRAVPILFAALERYGIVSNMGQEIVLESERNSVTWSIPERKLTLSGEEKLEISFDSNKQVISYQSELRNEYVEHLEQKIVPQLSTPKPTQIITKNISR